MRRSSVLALAILFTIASAAEAKTGPIHRRTVVAEDVRATLFFRSSDYGYPNPYRDVRVEIVRAGRKVGDFQPRPLDGALTGWGPALGVRGGPLHVVDLDGDGEAEVILDLYSGGAHCCEFSDIYRHAGGSYLATQKNWSSGGYTLKDVNHRGRAEFVAADSTFDYAFTAYAFSADPIQIWHYRSGVFYNVTRSFPEQVAAHPGGLDRRYRETLRGPVPREVRGILAAYVAAECLLDKCGVGFAVVERAETKGQLGKGSIVDDSPADGRYVAALRAFLRRHGYLR